MKRLITVVAAAALTVSAAVVSAPAQAASGGVATAADSASKPYVPPPISWGACSDPTLVRFGAQCGLLDGAAGLRAPERHEDPARGLAGQAQDAGRGSTRASCWSTPAAPAARA